MYYNDFPRFMGMLYIHMMGCFFVRMFGCVSAKQNAD
jgi:hypothetical protein